MQTEKEIKNKTQIIQNPWKIFRWEAFLFCLTLGLGIVAALKINALLEVQKIELPQISLWQFLLYFLFATCLIYLISRFVEFKPGKGLFFKGIFLLASFWGGGLFFSLWMPDILALILIGILIYWWFKKPSIFIHNLLVILGLVGVGTILGLSLSSQIVVLLLIILSIYDFIAVYKTKHMIKMAKAMIEAGTILAFIIPPEISDFKAGLGEVRPGGKFLILGGGDVAFPLLLCASLIPSGILDSIVVAVFALIGLFVSFWIFITQKKRQPIPALPPIALFSIIGFLLTQII